MRRFAADASHELRTPLVTIRGFSELYRHGALATPEDVATAMGRIESEAKRMGSMVEDLLLLGPPGRTTAPAAQTGGLQLLANDAVVDSLERPASGTISADRARRRAPAPAPVQGDEAKLRQVLGNLVGNALRYTPEGTPIELAVGVRTHARRSPSFSRCGTTAAAFRPRNCLGSSSASTGRTLHVRGRQAAADSVRDCRCDRRVTRRYRQGRRDRRRRGHAWCQPPLPGRHVRGT